jgi:predicted dehydrogenase
MKRIIPAMLVCLGVMNVYHTMGQTNSHSASVRLMTVDPGHFHAALVQKFMYPGVSPVVHVYAPPGDDLQEHLKRIERFNTRAEEPTSWQQKVYMGSDFFEKALADKSGNVVVLAGNNAKKTDYILKSVQAGLNVLADKPMVITPENLPKLEEAFRVAAAKKVLLYDIMTERFEITTILQRELSQNRELFGELVNGSPAEPAITKESVHHFSKVVAGAPLKRPQWFFDVRQEGEGIVDVTTHLVDLVQWEAFPGQIVKPSDVTMLNARRWSTAMTREQFGKVTGAEDFPAYLRNDVKDGALQVYSNGEMNYKLKNVHARVSVIWNFEAPPGTGDTHYSVMRGTKARLVIEQGEAQKFKPMLYVEAIGGAGQGDFEKVLKAGVASLQSRFTGVGVERDGTRWRVVVPEKYNVGHEAHFAEVTKNYLQYLHAGKLPDWEVPNMIAKYSTIMKAYEKACTTQ